jgi:hypothetical protein
MLCFLLLKGSNMSLTYEDLTVVKSLIDVATHKQQSNVLHFARILQTQDTPQAGLRRRLKWRVYTNTWNEQVSQVKGKNQLSCSVFNNLDF